jgi:hypothetical protein
VNEGTAAAREQSEREQQEAQAFLRPAHVVDGGTARYDGGIALLTAPP